MAQRVKNGAGRVFIFVNGILNCPGSHDGWTDKATTWVNARTKDRAEKFEYFCGPITRRLKIRSHAESLAALIAEYSKHKVILVGHSNGCELICRALRVSGVEIEAIHLISGACSADFERNGLNRALSSRVHRACVYVADSDLPMRIARVTGWFLGIFGLGYGTLGYKGPQKMTGDVVGRVKVIHRKGFGHSTWFDPENFHQLMIEVAMR